ncbi:hypothetical protein GXW82_03025 [Streptacidiphilus sp. 4-A2]|nr:hypothetical protein [Streptacidiphilus sp. 4-A2]
MLTAASPASSSSRFRPVTTERCSNTDRLVASDQATSSTSRPVLAESASPRRPACRASPAAVRPDTSHAVADPVSTGSGPVPGSGSVVAAAGSAAGASSISRCTLVPLIPKEDTPARRTRPATGHGWASASSRTSPSVQSTCGEGFSAYRERGSSRCWSASTIFITLAAPAAHWVWPILLFTEPSQSGLPSGRSCP